MAASETVKNFLCIGALHTAEVIQPWCSQIMSWKQKTPRPTKSSKNRIQQSTSIQKCASKCIFSHLFFTLGFGKLQKHQTAGFCLEVLYASLVELCAFSSQHLCRFSKAPKSDILWRFSSSPLPPVLQTSLRRTKKSFNSACDGLDGFNMRAELLSLQYFSAFFVCWFRFMHISLHRRVNTKKQI